MDPFKELMLERKLAALETIRGNYMVKKHKATPAKKPVLKLVVNNT